MNNQPASKVQLTTLGMRRVLVVASGFVLTVGISLNLLTEQTDRYFAWTVNPPLTAAFLGAAYWASFVLEYLSSRERVWARARLAVPAVLLFTTLTLVAALLHLDRFHLGSPMLITLAGTWVWLAVYVTVPPILAVLLFYQLRVEGGDPPRQAPLPGGLRLVLVLQAAMMLILGTGLFLWPLALAPVWPWMLTPLTGRVVAAWLVGVGTAAAHAAWENDRARLGPVMVSYALFGGLQLVALARYPATLDWSGLRAWLYLLFLISVLAAGLWGWLVGRRATAGADTAELSGQIPHSAG